MKQLINNMYTLLLQGHNLAQIRKKLDVSDEEWSAVSRNEYWHGLILGENPGGLRSVKQRLNEVRMLERDLFIALETRKMFEEGTKERAELTTRVNELQSKYSNFNVFNNF